MRPSPCLHVRPAPVLLLLLPALLAAGCARDEPLPPPAFPDEPAEPNPNAYPHVEQGLHEETLAAGTFTAGTPGVPPPRFPLRVPNGTVQVLVHLHLDQGASQGLQATLGACVLKVETPVVAQGQTITKDCGGGVMEGEQELLIDAFAGALAGRAEVVAKVCNRTAPGVSQGCYRLPAS